MTRLAIHQLAFGLAHGVLGATANRMGVWTQGCSLRHCPGCCSRTTWGADQGRWMNIETLVGLARAQSRPPSGLTVSGGEPTDQAPALAGLLTTFRAAFPAAEVVLYSGLRWPTLATRHGALLDLVDVVVAGPYVRTLPATPLAGSSNQEVRLLTPLAERLYRGWKEWPKHPLQVGGSNRLVTVGIPDTSRMDQAVAALGMGGRSWQTNISVEEGK